MKKVLIVPLASIAILGVVVDSRAAFVARQNTPAAATARPATRSASDVAGRIGQGAGAIVVADSTVGKERVPLPAVPATPQNVEQQIAELVKALPQGTTWAKLYLPGPPAGRAWSGDDVAAYAFAQKRLFGQVGTAPEGMMEILGQRLPAEKAQTHVSGLNLRPVYLITNPKAYAVASQNTDAASQWARMTPEQRQQYAQARAAQLLSADNGMRQGFMQEHMMVMSQLMRQMTPEQRQQMMQGSGAFIELRRGPGTEDLHLAPAP